jgi:enamine deaminase RidA (YjgF/YER057c/UK114 family)
MLNINSALRQAGATISDVVRVRYILTDRKEFPHCWEVLRKWFGEVRPAATMVQAGLFEEVMKIEIEVTARIQGQGDNGKGEGDLPE